MNAKRLVYWIVQGLVLAVGFFVALFPPTTTYDLTTMHSNAYSSMAARTSFRFLLGTRQAGGFGASQTDYAIVLCIFGFLLLVQLALIAARLDNRKSE